MSNFKHTVLLGHFWVKKRDFELFWLIFLAIFSHFYPFPAISVTFLQNHPVPGQIIFHRGPRANVQTFEQQNHNQHSDWWRKVNQNSSSHQLDSVQND